MVKIDDKTYEKIEMGAIIIVLLFAFFTIINSNLTISITNKYILSIVLTFIIYSILTKYDQFGHYLTTLILLFYIGLEIPGLSAIVFSSALFMLIAIWTEIINPEEHISETSLCLVWAIIIAKIVLTVLHATLATSTPIVAVISNSMKHDGTRPDIEQYVKENNFPLSNGFQGGDVLLVVGKKPNELKVGDVIVYSNEIYNMPIVHRIMKMDCDDESCAKVNKIITRGDHNSGPDTWNVNLDNIQGKAVFRIPRIGLIKAAPVCFLSQNCYVFSCIIEGNCREVKKRGFLS